MNVKNGDPILQISNSPVPVTQYGNVHLDATGSITTFNKYVPLQHRGEKSVLGNEYLYPPANNVSWPT